MKNKININRPEISSEEIAKGKDFGSVLKNQKPMSNPLFKKPLFLSGVILATIAIITSIFLLTKESPNKSNDAAHKEIITNTDSTTLAEFYKKEIAKPCISPPLDGVNI